MLYLTPQEQDELTAILAATPEPVEIVLSVIRPDKSVQSHLLRKPDGTMRELSADEIAARGLPAPEPEINGGYRAGEGVTL